MTARPSLAAAGLAAVLLLFVSACSSSSSSTSAPTTGPTSAASDAGSAAAPSAAESAPAAPTAAAPGGALPDPKTLLSTDQAASIIGGALTPVAFPVSIPNMSIASFGNADGDSVTVFVEAIPGGMASAQLQAAVAMAGAKGDLQPVSGIGDAAGKEVNANDATVAFVKGSTLVVVQATSGTATGTDLEPKLEAVARQVAGKL